MNKYNKHFRVLGCCLLLALAWPLQAETRAQDQRAWSWQESLTPLDVAELTAGQREDAWFEVEESRFRALREGVVAQALQQLSLPAGASDLEALLRGALLYYTPEFETYWPPYAEAGTLRIKRWPVRARIERQTATRWVLSFELGRPQDDARQLRLAYEGGWLASVSLTRLRYTTADLETPLSQTRTLVFLDGAPATATLFEELDGVWQPARLGFETGTLAPSFGQLHALDAPASDGVALLLAYDKYDGTPLSRLVFDPREAPLAFQIVRGIVAQAQSQLGATADPEVEKALRQQLLEFSPWGFLNEADQAHLFTSAYELVSIRKLEANSDVVRYQLVLGNVLRRTLTVALTPATEAPSGWRLAEVALDFPFRDDGGWWHEQRAMRFQADGLATLQRWFVNAQGAVVTPVAERTVATFGL